MKLHKVKYGLILLSLVVSIGSVLLIQAIGNTSKAVVAQELRNSGLDSLRVATENGEKKLDNTDIIHLKNDVEMVKEATPISYEVKELILGKHRQSVFLWEIDENSMDVVSVEVIHGRSIQKEDLLKKEKVCVIDKELAEKAYKRENVVGKTIAIELNGKKETIQIVGITDSSKNLMKSFLSGYLEDFIYLPYTTAGKTSFEQIGVQLKEGSSERSAIAQIKLSMRKKNGDAKPLKVSQLALQKKTFDQIFFIITTTLKAIGSISLVIAGLMIMSLMVTSVGERTFEIGVKKALGATNLDIMLEFLLESVLLCIMGFFLSLLFLFFVQLVAIYFHMSLIIKMKNIFSVGFVSLFMGVVFGVYPAFTAAKLKPVDAFKRQ